MSSNKTESLHFYHYLCHKIGSEKQVKAKRLTFMAEDISSYVQVSSGSRSEGLNLKGSDIDLMLVHPAYKVYESETKIVQKNKSVLIMETAETYSCFTRLRLYTNYMIMSCYAGMEMLEQHGKKYFISNKLFKQSFLKLIRPGYLNKIHGPCLSDANAIYDIANCLKCDKWISQSVPWINRPRSSCLSPEIISKITKSGVLFVPIGFKGSKHEDLEWRISFSVAEKILIFSYNHTQLLCYVLLKIVLKEIIEVDEGLKGLRCSYYIKTLMFWIFDDSSPTIWKPDNMIRCFKACLQRLLYCVEYSTLLHYFIPDYNFFEVRVRTELEKKEKMINLLTNLYQQGIESFSASKTLDDFTRFSTATNTQWTLNYRIIRDVFLILALLHFRKLALVPLHF